MKHYNLKDVDPLFPVQRLTNMQLIDRLLVSSYTATDLKSRALHGAAMSYENDVDLYRNELLRRLGDSYGEFQKAMKGKK
jgi:hypothetical protein